MPVGLVETGKSPNHIAAIQTRADMNVLGDIGVVVKHQKLMMHDRAIQQQSGNSSSAPSSIGFWRRLPVNRSKGWELTGDLYHTDVAISSEDLSNYPALDVSPL